MQLLTNAVTLSLREEGNKMEHSRPNIMFLLGYSEFPVDLQLFCIRDKFPLGDTILVCNGCDGPMMVWEDSCFL